jgi:inner membrane protein involved in colicin E2 resistance
MRFMPSRQTRRAMEDTAVPLPPLAAAEPRRARNHAVMLKLLLITCLVLLLQLPLFLVNLLRQDRMRYRHIAAEAIAAPADASASAPGMRSRATSAPALPSASSAAQSPARNPVIEGYRLVDRSLKYGVLVVSLVFAAFFLFEIIADLRLHPFHYALVGAALSLFYLALLALGEIWSPAQAYLGAAVASSLLITLYSAAILRSRGRAVIVAALLTAVYGSLYIVLRMEEYALLAGTAALFVALGAVMYFTRHIDWYAPEARAIAR